MEMATATIKIELGGETREIKPLTLRQSAQWRQGILTMLSDLGNTDIGDYDPLSPLQSWQRVLTSIITILPRQIEAMVFSYLALSDPSLDQEWIRDHATDEEIADALMAFVLASFSMLWKFGELVRKLSVSQN